jgi:hypothetical protein
VNPPSALAFLFFVRHQAPSNACMYVCMRCAVQAGAVAEAAGGFTGELTELDDWSTRLIAARAASPAETTGGSVGDGAWCVGSGIERGGYRDGTSA